MLKCYNNVSLLDWKIESNMMEIFKIVHNFTIQELL